MKLDRIYVNIAACTVLHNITVDIHNLPGTYEDNVDQWNEEEFVFNGENAFHFRDDFVQQYFF